MAAIGAGRHWPLSEKSLKQFSVDSKCFLVSRSWGGTGLVGYNQFMSITEVKTIISQLPPPDLADFAAWFEEFQEDAWDR